MASFSGDRANSVSKGGEAHYRRVYFINVESAVDQRFNLPEALGHSTADKLAAGKEEYASVDVSVPGIHRLSSPILILVETTS